ncbi:hypothetical protein J3R82DRAFT_6868 [Butyriboletus roseoflavus]|nr:hypothetical protein J3R82DRAFT_6868 [Butyriboletus roseoflavus]
MSVKKNCEIPNATIDIRLTESQKPVGSTKEEIAPKEQHFFTRVPPLRSTRSTRTYQITFLFVQMSTDPYHVVQQEIQSSLQTASTLRASYLRIRSTAHEENEELVWARNEVRSFVRPPRPSQNLCFMGGFDPRG